MYEKPQVVPFGSFRELTRGGGWAFDLDWGADSIKEFFLHENEPDHPTAS